MTFNSAKRDDVKTFIPAKKWLGQKKGFYFGTGNEGTGYYIDSAQKHKEETVTKRKKSVKIAEDQNEMKILLESLEKEALHDERILGNQKGGFCEWGGFCSQFSKTSS